MDLELTGSGPLFSIDYPAPRNENNDLPPAVVSISSVVNESAGIFEVEYNVGARVAVRTSIIQRGPGQPGSHKIEFRDLALRGTVQMKPGEPITLARQNGKKLSLTLIKGE